MIETLNTDCLCLSLDRAELQRALEADPAAQGLGRLIEERCPHLFAALPVFVSRKHVDAMAEVIRAVESVVALPAYRESLAWMPEVARFDSGARGVFMGYDFHLGAEGPRLIEINTNAGGAILNVAARDAQVACCAAGSNYLEALPTAADLEREIIGMFRCEWRLARGHAPLRSIAIVDEDPANQFLHPEFLLAKRLFESHGIAAHIADTTALRIERGRVYANDQPIDMVYNRSTDFYFESPASAVLREALAADLAVITPHPRAHALYANKRNLVLLSDFDRLAALGAPADAIADLRRIVPVTRAVKRGDEGWWKDRKDWFFKPESGFGSRGTYRGDKLTRRAFSEVMSGDYIAQSFAPAGERLRLKADIRCYVYDSRIQLMAARLYQGQTTNFRTAGGGFAPVYVTR